MVWYFHHSQSGFKKIPSRHRFASPLIFLHHFTIHLGIIFASYRTFSKIKRRRTPLQKLRPSSLAKIPFYFFETVKILNAHSIKRAYFQFDFSAQFVKVTLHAKWNNFVYAVVCDSSHCTLLLKIPHHDSRQIIHLQPFVIQTSNQHECTHEI